MDIRSVPIHEINRAVYNPRIDLKPGDPDYEKLSSSISSFGYIEPLVWNERTGTLVSGHQRLKILIEKGLTEVQVSVVDLPLEKEKQLNIILNKVRGDWDEDKLSFLLRELSEVPNFDIAATGFDLPEISEILDRNINQDIDDNFDVETAVDSIDEPITKLGEVINLGVHRLLCGDSGNHEDLKKLMGDEKADQVDTDIPYNVNLGVKSKKKQKWDPIASDNMPQNEYEAWMRKIFENIKKFLRPGAAIYIWQGHRQFPPMYQILLDLDFHVSCVIAWVKEAAAFSYADYSFRSEQCLYGWLNGAPHYFAGKPGETNIWEVKRDATNTYQHPTQKPVALRQRSVKNSSKHGDIVLDVFLGSGSLLLACESLGRRCYGIEIDPKYCDVIVRRYIAFIGKDKVSAEILERYSVEVRHDG